MPRPILATIYPLAIAHNLALARSKAPRSFLWAVIKANAYGHGIEHVYSGLQGADGLAMLDFSEAKRIRALGWRKPILMLEGCFDSQDISTCTALDLTPIIHSHAQLALHALYRSPLSVQIKINSGMNRLGFSLAGLDQVALQLLQLQHLKVAMWMTHFANADVDAGLDADLDADVQDTVSVAPAASITSSTSSISSTSTALALAAFEKSVQTVVARYPALAAPLSACNSAALLAFPAAHHSAVRCGVAMYGASAFGAASFGASPQRSADALGLQAAMVFTSQIIAVQALIKGDSVGYGSTFTASGPMRIGIVACGYADGYPRHAPTGTPIAVQGMLTHTLGRVSMDMLAVDLSDLPDANIGSPVELWGTLVPIDAVAHSAGTIAYELMCAIAPRVPVVVE